MDNTTEAASCRQASNFHPRKWQNLSHRNKFKFGNWRLNHTGNRYLNLLQGLFIHNTSELLSMFRDVNDTMAISGQSTVVELTHKMSGIPTEVITGS